MLSMRDPFCSWILTFVPKRSVLYTWMGNSQKRINNADLIDVVVLGRLYETSFNIVCLKLAKLETWKTSLSGFWNIEWAAILVRARTHWTIITRGRYSLLTIIRELILETSVLLFDIACRMIRCAYKLFVKFYIAGNSEGFFFYFWCDIRNVLLTGELKFTTLMKNRCCFDNAMAFIVTKYNVLRFVHLFILHVWN